MKNRINRAIATAWAAIGPDVISSCESEVDFDSAAEVVLASDHLECHGGDPDAVAALRRLPYHAARRIARGLRLSS